MFNHDDVTQEIQRHAQRLSAQNIPPNYLAESMPLIHGPASVWYSSGNSTLPMLPVFRVWHAAREGVLGGHSFPALCPAWIAVGDRHRFSVAAEDFCLPVTSEPERDNHHCRHADPRIILAVLTCVE